MIIALYWITVLILVLLELILLQVQGRLLEHIKTSFNPCFIGTYSFTAKITKDKEILVQF